MTTNMTGSLKNGRRLYRNNHQSSVDLGRHIIASPAAAIP